MCGEFGVTKAVPARYDAPRSSALMRCEMTRASAISVARVCLLYTSDAADAYRLAFSGTDPQRPPVLYIDLVLLTHGRGLAGLLFAGVVTPPARATEIALARVISQRMRAALRGAS